ncbi:UDP-N-acetylmuramoyl-L-alanyl-D-glutamate--2,6-diaminopimelate ligase [Halomonas sp. TRM85114]|uniref:UDP-N-acetylmuramoyl-L-alanyl-D-glutamate--2, 6-diaminopimelate ligase n=1 Tax=Halomonas jincaotanensis TaxID=2810616 RepID=UPI001BD4F34B|nr:UDP-N-acetylmuramoyl-L-alanyl-D-glutamate--2,6-diaminopimelate ligase [Halomonas jincaotanensis]MBS9402091.1 UDP-N-acetylmuramoyl-L-alanyl-D-glutamate--2,6-diaminopimelate ligase [Halomonas jincaotanensis]
MQVADSRLEASLLKHWPRSRRALAALSLPAACRLEVDSRRLSPGDVFVAVPGVAADGRHFIDEALAAGASLVLAHQEGHHHHDDPRVLWLSGLKETLGTLGRECFAVPDDLEVIGVTGTNGKSSVTHYLAALSEALGVSTGLIGTLGQGRISRLLDTGLTTPGALSLQAALGDLAAAKVTRVAMEVSSHALEQGRLDGCRISAAVFTNLTRDHLDYHGSMAGYAAAKARLFRRTEIELAVVNSDDPLARLMLAGLVPGVRVLAVGEQEATTLRVVDWVPHAQGQRALIATPEGERVIDLGLMGRFTLDNVLLAIAVLYGLGHSLEVLFTAASDLAPVPGRMEALGTPGSPTVVIDYAHTPDALDNALTALRAHLPGEGRLWCVFGCGGDRDTGKRAWMAAAAERQADVIVVTDDNPRSEDPASIREQILAGLSRGAREIAWYMDDRGRAIDRVLTEASDDDVVLIAGKGHETYQEIAGVRHDFSDRVEAEKALSARIGRPGR